MRVLLGVLLQVRQRAQPILAITTRAKWDLFLMLQGCLLACCVRLGFTQLLLDCLLVPRARVLLKYDRLIYLQQVHSNQQQRATWRNFSKP